MRKQLLILGIAALSLQSCVQTTYLNVQHAAEIDIPADLDSVIVVNKTKVAKGDGNQLLNVLEGMVSGEPILGDKYGAKSSVENMQRLVRESERMDLLHDEIIDVRLKDLSGDTPLKGEFVDSICKEYGADGLISLELFDSDSYNSSSSAQVITQWRLYYPNERKIIDEFKVYSYANDYAHYTVVPTAYTSISRAGAMGAQIYFNRIVPWYRREAREYYTSGSHEMKAAKKSVRQNDWNQATYYWEVETESQTDQKTVGKASYNLALASEIKGDIDKALEWIDASIAAGNNKAISYKAILRMRKDELVKIEAQLKRE